MSGHVLDARAREIIVNVTRYFEDERDTCRVLLKDLTNVLQLQCAQSSNISVPKELLYNIAEHLNNTKKVTERVVTATCVSKNTVTKIKYEKMAADKAGTRMKAPVRKVRGKIPYFNVNGILALKDIINMIITQTQKAPTLQQVLEFAQSKLGYTGSKTTLRKIILDNLRYKFGCPDSLILIGEPIKHEVYLKEIEQEHEVETYYVKVEKEDSE